MEQQVYVDGVRCLTLVDELVEGVLSVGPGLAPHDWSGVVVHTGAVFGDVLPVRLHVALTTTHTVHCQSRQERAMAFEFRS